MGHLSPGPARQNGRADGNKPGLLLYIHVPFCLSKCAYCAFASAPPASESDWQTYQKALLKEIALWSTILNRPAASTLFFGGGTPSLMPEKMIAEILEALHQAFRLEKGFEFTLEANPDSADDEKRLRSWKKAGAGRLSLGVQSFDDDKLKSLGRLHNSSQAVGACLRGLELGFKLNMDLIFGLPGQSLKNWMNNLKKAVELKPHHLSCYGLSLEPGTPLAASLDPDVLPGEKEQARMYVEGGDFLESEGFFQYEISNFSRMGLHCKHNSGYWQGCDYLGLGPSAVSTISGMRRTNPAELAAWVETAGRLEAGHSHRLSPLEKLREFIMLSLRTSRGLDPRACQALGGENPLIKQAGLIAALRGNGLARLKNGRLSLTRTGMAVSNSIIERLLP